MPLHTPSEHHQQAIRNAALAERLIQDEPAWATTIFFYAALHRLDGLAAHGQRAFPNHRERTAWLKYDCPELQPVMGAYLKLYELSRVARYECPDGFTAVSLSSTVGTKIKAHYERFVAAIDRIEAAQASESPSPS